MQKTIQKSILLAALLSQLSANQTITLAPLTVTSTAITTDELKSTNSVEVYTKEDIEKAHVQNVYEFLNKSTSVFATPAYGNPFLQKIDMRGFGVGDGYQNIVVTINGRKMNNVDMVSQLLSSISPSSIEKIELIKSSGIVIGGDGANAGIINIITKQSNDAELSLYLGNYGTRDSSFYFGHKDDKFSVNISGEAQKNDGIRDIDSKGNKDSNNFSTGTFNLSYTPNQDIELHLGVTATRTDVIYAGTMKQSEYKNNPAEQGSGQWGLSSSTHQKYSSDVLDLGTSYYFNDKISLNVDISRELKKSNYITYSSITDYQYNAIDANLEYIDDTFSIIAGIDGFDGYLNRTNLELNKNNMAAFITSQIALDELTITAGYRFEKVSFNKLGGDNKKDSLHGVELGFNYLINDNSSIFVDYSHSYQSASLDRLFSLFSGSFLGYVEPSKANSYSVGYSKISQENKLKISLFYIDLKDEIYYYSDPTYVSSRNTNIDQSHKYGVDIHDNYIINDRLDMTLNYNYVQAIIDKELENGNNYAGNNLPGVSNHNIKAMINYLPNEHTTFSLTQVYRSKAYAAEDFNNNFTQKQDAFNSTDISANYAKDNWEVFAKINNVFKQKNGLWVRDDAIYPVTYATTGFIGLKLKY